MAMMKRSSSDVEVEGRNRMDCLPEEVVVEILSRLPITSLMQFKTASHSCHHLSSDPRLPLMFFKRVSSLSSAPSLILHCSSNLPNEVYILDTDHKPMKARKVRINARSRSEVSKLELVGSCNGLLCLRLPNPRRCGKLETDILQVYNPFAGDVVELPRATRYMDQEEVFGFGFHPRSGEYKVVRIVSYSQLMTPALGGLHDGFMEVEKSAVEVLSLKTNAWRNKGPSPEELLDLKAPQALVEGSLHWLCSSNSITAFDLGDEAFRKVPCPESMTGMNWHAYNLATLGGCLSLSAVSLAGNVMIDVWRMKQYNVKESWVKELSFSPIVPPGRPDLDWNWLAIARYYRMICVMKNGEFLMQYGGSHFVSYDPVKNKFKALQITGLPHQFQPLPLVPSLFSAKAAIQMSC